MKALRALATQIVALQKQARALGLFADDRELLTCAKCGLLEDVTFGDHPESSCLCCGFRLLRGFVRRRGNEH